MARPLSPMARSLPDDSTMIRAEMRFERVVMVWRVVRVDQSRPWFPVFLTGRMGGLMGATGPERCQFAALRTWSKVSIRPSLTRKAVSPLA